MGVVDPFDDLDRCRPDELRAWWQRRVRHVLRTAQAELPFYRARFEAAGFDAGRFRRLEDLARVPVIAKRDLLDVQRERGDFRLGLERGAEAAGTVLAASSGTHGTTFVALPPRWRQEQGRSALRAHWWAGLRPGAPFLLSAPAWHTYATVQTYFAERLDLSCVVVAGTYLPRFAPRIVDALVSFRPRFVTLFLPMVFSLLGAARARGLPAREPFASVESLVVTGAPITPGMRRRLEQETGVARIVQLAGSSENLLAVECAERRGLHVVPDTCYVEVLEEGGVGPAPAGTRGRVVHTALVPHGSLYIRYDGGDLGTLETSECPCGLPSPRVTLLGRVEERFVLGGRACLPYDVQEAVEAEVPELAGVAFALVREAVERERLALRFGEGEAAPAALEALRERLGRRFGCAVEAERVGTLPLRFKGVPAFVSEKELG